LLKYVLNFNCEMAMMLEIPLLSAGVCAFEELTIMGMPFWPVFNQYDIRKKCKALGLCYPDDGLTTLFNKKSTQKAIGVKHQKTWQECDWMVHIYLIMDLEQNYGKYLADSLDKGLKVLVYYGDKDFLANWRGGQAWTDNLVWKHQERF
jgi:carboxypeptidase C (cathepsin A)